MSYKNQTLLGIAKELKEKGIPADVESVHDALFTYSDLDGEVYSYLSERNDGMRTTDCSNQRGYEDAISEIAFYMEEL